MGDERGDDADQRPADVYSSARIGAAAAFTIVLVVLLVLDVAVPDYDINPGMPDIYHAWFLTEYHSAKEGEVDSATKELLAIAASARNEGDENVLCTPYHVGAARFEGADLSALNQVFDLTLEA